MVWTFLKKIRFKKLTVGTLLSILVFFSISFVQFLIQIPPIKEYRADLKIGFPFNYFYELYLKDGLNHAWNPANLLLDCFIVWLIVNGIILIIRRN